MLLFRHCWFTLIELLTVIVIIGILCTLMLPALKASMDSARQTQCASNLRQLSSASFAFATDHNGYCPQLLWFGYDIYGLPEDDGKALNCYGMANLLSYGIGKAKKCPATPEAYHGYGINVNAVRNKTGDPWGPDNVYYSTRGRVRVSRLNRPSVKLYYSDTIFSEARNYCMYYSDMGTMSISWLYMDFRHASKSNCVFFDGHLKSIHLYSDEINPDVLFTLD